MSRAHLPDGSRVLILGRPGVVVACPDAETVAVRLDGEVRVDHWHRSQVTLCPHSLTELLSVNGRNLNNAARQCATCGEAVAS